MAAILYRFQRVYLCIYILSLADEDEVLVGISLTCEAYISNAQHDICLGVVSIEPRHTTIGQLRNLIISQLGTLPASFSFITHQGWVSFIFYSHLHLLEFDGLVQVYGNSSALAMELP